ncbi:MAG: acyltransferase family protein [Oligoflexus sp.]
MSRHYKFHKQSQRIHGLDALRATMMLLGLVIHAAASYIPTPANADWPFRDPHSSWIMMNLGLFIHVFRMPTFYVVAGFFAALLISKQGENSFIRNRLQRILIPFVIAWLILYPLTSFGFSLAIQGELKLREGLYAIGWDTPGVLLHLWFLYFLLIMYGLTLGFRNLSRAWPHVSAKVNRMMTRVLQSRWRLVWISLPMIGLMLPAGYLKTSMSLAPNWQIFAAYTYCFFIGWQMLHLKEQFNRLFQPWPFYLLIGVTASAINQYALIQLRTGNVSLNLALLSSVCAAFACWGIVLGSFGLFLRFFSKDSKKVRYLVDASYWVYLIHLPIIAFTAALLKPFAWPALLKFSMVLAVTSFASLASYELFVRYTFIGRSLNGERNRPSRKQSSEVVAVKKV